MDFVYANKITMTVSQTECFLKFDFICPDIDEKGAVIGDKITNKSSVVISKEAFIKLREMMNGVEDEGELKE